MEVNLLQSLLDHSVEYATDLLNDTGEFYPFAAYTDKLGQVHPLEFEVDKKKIPNNSQVLEALTLWCTKELETSGISGYALVFEASVTIEEGKPAMDTICVDIHTKEESSSPLYYFPFSIKEEGEVTYGEAFAVVRPES